MAFDLRVMSFKAGLQLISGVDRYGEAAGISNAAVLRQLVEHGLTCLENGSLQLQPEPFLRSNAKKISRSLKRKYRKNGKNRRRPERACRPELPEDAPTGE